MGRGKPALRELMHRLTPRTQHKASVCKVPRPYVKELHQLKHLLGVQAHVKIFSGNRDTDRHHFVPSIHLALSLPLADAIIALPLPFQSSQECHTPWFSLALWSLQAFLELAYFRETQKLETLAQTHTIWGYKMVKHPQINQCDTPN